MAVSRTIPSPQPPRPPRTTTVKSSLDQFRNAVREAGLEEKVHCLMHGETCRFTLPGVTEASLKYRGREL